MEPSARRLDVGAEICTAGCQATAPTGKISNSFVLLTIIFSSQHSSVHLQPLARESLLPTSEVFQSFPPKSIQ
ncbi:hypothetical protein FJTKL_08642 [Diaporthe vaccinii]|uniref:Uncharacterized protein n=1 Tax=Diaporthe vaccinii TaxID=105482 RepID=A0ABR4EQU1_9PEZI